MAEVNIGPCECCVECLEDCGNCTIKYRPPSRFIVGITFHTDTTTKCNACPDNNGSFNFIRNNPEDCNDPHYSCSGTNAQGDSSVAVVNGDTDCSRTDCSPGGIPTEMFFWWGYIQFEMSNNFSVDEECYIDFNFGYFGCNAQWNTFTSNWSVLGCTQLTYNIVGTPTRWSTDVSAYCGPTGIFDGASAFNGLGLSPLSLTLSGSNVGVCVPGSPWTVTVTAV